MSNSFIKTIPYGELGQALTELMIVLVALIPIFLMLPIVGAMLDIQFKVHEAARYVAWERTIWAENNRIAAQEGEVVKSSPQLERETAHLFFRSPLVAVHQKTAEESRQIAGNSLWKGYRHSRLVADDVITTNVATKRQVSNKKEKEPYRLRERYLKTPGVNVMDVMTEQTVAGFKLGLPFSGKNSLSHLEIHRPLNEIVFPGSLSFMKKSPQEAQSDRFEPVLRSRGAILSQVWSVPNEEVFAKTVRTLVADGMTLALGAEQIGYAFKLFADPLSADVFLFKEINHAFKNNTALVPNEMSRVLPDYASHEVSRPRSSLVMDPLEWLIP